MKRTLVIGALVLAGLLTFPAAANADHRSRRWGVSFGFGFDGAHVDLGYSRHRHHHRPVHVHVRAPIYRQIWVAPVYDTVIAGYDRCGRPSYRTVQVRCGYYDSVVVGYRCSGCGAYCD
ncbi:MAG: hypothetical protein HY721_20700 [Planctomycetes bacterium]|nr:hypothetical protein [Planctomycetota bacterium]